MVQYNLKAQKGQMCMSGLLSTFDRSRVITESIQLAKSKRFCFYIVMSTVKMSEIVFSSFQHFLLDLAEQNPIKLTQPRGCYITCYHSNTKFIQLLSFSLEPLKCRSPDVSACAFSPALASAASPASQSCVLPSVSGACCVCKPLSLAPSPESCLFSYMPPHPVSTGDVKELQSDPISIGHNFISTAEQ